MTINIYNGDSHQYIKTISDKEFFDMCNGDKRMYDDYIRHLKNKPYVKVLHEIWQMID